MLTGCAWLVLHYAIGGDMEGLPHPWEAWCMRLHGLGMVGGLFILGALAAAHVPRGWNMTRRQHNGQQRTSGIALCALAALLAATGYLLYYFAPEALRPALGWLHALAGIAAAAILLLHNPGR